jgi:hypothetical protein
MVSNFHSTWTNTRTPAFSLSLFLSLITCMLSDRTVIWYIFIWSCLQTMVHSFNGGIVGAYFAMSKQPGLCLYQFKYIIFWTCLWNKYIRACRHTCHVHMTRACIRAYTSARTHARTQNTCLFLVFLTLLESDYVVPVVNVLMNDELKTIRKEVSAFCLKYWPELA